MKWRKNYVVTNNKDCSENAYAIFPSEKGAQDYMNACRVGMKADDWRVREVVIK